MRAHACDAAMHGHGNSKSCAGNRVRRSSIDRPPSRFSRSDCVYCGADKRFFAKKTAFDLILGFILASMLSRAINGSEQLVPTIVAGFVLALLHRILGMLACSSPTFAGWIKGHAQTLIENGIVDEQQMSRHRLGHDDLQEESPTR
jgi:hypothetical protein